jgi:hypothetical protein
VFLKTNKKPELINGYLENKKCDLRQRSLNLQIFNGQNSINPTANLKNLSLPLGRVVSRMESLKGNGTEKVSKKTPTIVMTVGAVFKLCCFH